MTFMAMMCSFLLAVGALRMIYCLPSGQGGHFCHVFLHLVFDVPIPVWIAQTGRLRYHLDRWFRAC